MRYVLDIEVEPVDFWCNHCDSALIQVTGGIYRCLICDPFPYDNDGHLQPGYCVECD